MKSSLNKRSTFGRRLLLGTSIFALVGSLGAFAASCGSVLPDITPGYCGNRVIEPLQGEDCDDELTGKCGAPGSYAPCRYICDEPSDCDPGYGCGLDGICRQSGGLSEFPFSIGATGARQLLSGDFDGDGRDEIVTADGNVATVHFLTTEGFIASSQSFPYTGVTPAIGDVNGDGYSDLALALDHTMSVWLGQEDRTLIPQSLPLMYSNRGTQRIVPLGTYTGDGYVLALTEGVGVGPASFIQFMPDGSYARKPITGIPLPGANLKGAIATRGIVDGLQPCALIAGEIEALLESQVAMVKRCKGTDAFTTLWNISLKPGAKPWAGVYLHDTDNDGIEELIYGVSTNNGAVKELLVDKFDGMGMPVKMPDPFLQHDPGNCMPDGILASEPLAVADLNGDGQVDFVDSRGLLLSNNKLNPKPYKRICHAYKSFDPMSPQKIDISWTSAVVGNFNGDKWPDVLAARKNLNIIDLWTWKPEGLTTIPISVPAPVQDLVAGDLDGDTITDVAFRIVPPVGDSLGPTPIFAIFGNPSALPSAPQPVGVIRGVKQLLMGRLQGENQIEESDVFDDLLVLADEWDKPGADPTGESPLTLIRGSSTRSLGAPLILQSKTRPPVPPGMDMPKPEYVPITGMVISDFGLPVNYTDPLELDPSTIVVAAERQLWTAGFRPDGSSYQITSDNGAGNGELLLVPVDAVRLPFPEEIGESIDEKTLIPVETTQMAVFADSDEGPGIWFIEQIGTDMFMGSPEDATSFVDHIPQLPRATKPDVPYVFADLDANGRRDVVLVAEQQLEDLSYESTIVVYWNGDEKLESRAFSLFDQTPLLFDPPFVQLADGGAGSGGMGMGGMGDDPIGMLDAKRILDIAAINYDNDKYLELAILTRGGIYIADLSVTEIKSTTNSPETKFERTLDLIPDNPIARVQGGDALLTIDANSDGIDDLVVGDPGKLLLFFGAERQ